MENTFVYKNRNPAKKISGDVKMRTVIQIGLVTREKKATTMPMKYINGVQFFFIIF